MIDALRSAVSSKKSDKSEGYGDCANDSYNSSKRNLNRLMKSLRSGKLKNQDSLQRVVIFGRS